MSYCGREEISLIDGSPHMVVGSVRWFASFLRDNKVNGDVIWIGRHCHRIPNMPFVSKKSIAHEDSVTHDTIYVIKIKY